MKAVELQALVSHQLLSLVSQDPRLGDKTVSIIRKNPHKAMRDSLDASLISYSQKGAQSMTHEPQTSCLAFCHTQHHNYFEHTHNGNWGVK